MRLAELVTVSKGKKPSAIKLVPDEKDVRLLQIEDLREGAVPRFAPLPPAPVLAQPTDIVMAWDGANAGTSHFGLAGLAGSTLAVLRPRDHTTVHTPYLGHFLKSRQRYLRATCKGATVPHIDPSRLGELELPVPPLAEQRSIAAILDQTDALLAQRRQALSTLDELSQSMFVDMFGDPIQNPRGLPLVPLGELGRLDRGVSKHRPRNDPALLGGDHPLIQTGDVANSGGYIREYSSTYSDLGLAQSRMWPAGTLCITIAANIAKTGILTFDACFPDSVVGFTADAELTTYVRIWMSFLQRSLEAAAPQSAQKNINLAILRALLVPIPEQGQLRQFGQLIEAVENRRAEYRRSLAAHTDMMSETQAWAFAKTRAKV